MNQKATVARQSQLTSRYFVTVVAVTLIYLATAKFGLSLAFATKQVTAIWPPTGIAVAALLLFGYRLWPAILLGAFFVNATANEPPITAAGIAVGNTLGPLVTVFLLRKFARFDNDFARVRDALGLCVCGAVGMTVTASNGVANLALAGIVPWSDFGSVWWIWWVGDTMGVVVVASLVLTWVARTGLDYDLKKVGELAALLVGLCGLGLIALTGTLFDGSVLTSYNFALLPSVIWAFVIWGALRFSQRETATIVALIIGLAVWGAVHDRGPFTSGNLDERLILLELYMAAVVLTGLALGAVTTERRRAQEALQKAHDKLEIQVGERMRAETALRQKTRELEASNAELEEFAYVASHDLQEPLRKIDSFSQLAEETLGADIPEEAKNYLTRIRGSAARQQEMIRQLLEWSRASMRTETREKVDLTALVLEVFQYIHVEAAARDARLEVDDMPPVRVAPEAIRHLFLNLLGNSVKYRRTNAPLAIRVSARARGVMAEVAVEDNGIGFEQQYAEQIFKPFHRLHGRGQYPGSGIGLAICRKIVERHGGTINANGRPGEGATFRFTLPIMEDQS